MVALRSLHGRFDDVVGVATGDAVAVPGFTPTATSQVLKLLRANHARGEHFGRSQVQNVQLD
jgi:hypothetical protein